MLYVVLFCGVLFAITSCLVFCLGSYWKARLARNARSWWPTGEYIPHIQRRVWKWNSLSLSPSLSFKKMYNWYNCEKKHKTAYQILTFENPLTHSKHTDIIMWLKHMYDTTHYHSSVSVGHSSHTDIYMQIPSFPSLYRQYGRHLC